VIYKIDLEIVFFRLYLQNNSFSEFCLGNPCHHNPPLISKNKIKIAQIDGIIAQKITNRSRQRIVATAVDKLLDQGMLN
tara:strand:- start:284 stop:520 length:237 start_codon:yes stop_codon:yes gene_type:complete